MSGEEKAGGGGDVSGRREAQREEGGAELGPAPGEAGAAPLAPGGEGLAGSRLGDKKTWEGAGGKGVGDYSQLGCESLGFPQPQKGPWSLDVGSWGLLVFDRCSRLRV